jgi:hypothetical protein
MTVQVEVDREAHATKPAYKVRFEVKSRALIFVISDALDRSLEAIWQPRKFEPCLFDEADEGSNSVIKRLSPEFRRLPMREVVDAAVPPLVTHVPALRGLNPERVGDPSHIGLADYPEISVASIHEG